MKSIIKQRITRHSMSRLCRTIFTSPVLVITIISILLSGCGGGGDDGATEITSPPTSVTPTADTTTPTTTPPETTTPDPDPEPIPDPTSMDDLIVDANNTMQAAFQLAVSIEMDSTKRAYFSLCDEFSGSNNNYRVNFESCQYRGPTANGKLDTDLKIANHNGQLIAVLWFYDGTAPHYQIWQYDDQAQDQRLTLN
ncbi:putative lipoprotein [Shewanella sediminis HAW-EB3]|uniref:Putative lipoprotein n=1 Tax=Shewanella sediminis (strain HAW-EB3) TaxID=425104 RepID=A8FT05_SHESH|nr:hypothetical protein [Shewanella sediminis]ABV35978.1 putative lipoprotein [Shewanella sediminis HAW-EB3]